MSQQLLFVNFEGNPAEELQQRQNHTLVMSHVGKYYRNRSKPSRTHAESASQARCTSINTVAGPKVRKIKLITFLGNSDPFNSMPISIDPSMNDILKFYQQTARGAMSKVSPTGWAFWEANESSDGLATALMSDPTVVVSFAARAAMLASVVTAKYGGRALALSTRSMKSLRRAIRDNQDMQARGFYMRVIIHFSLETLAGNYEAARTHGRILRRIYRNQKHNQDIDFVMLRYVLHMDTIYSAKFLTMSLFDAREWYVTELGWDAMYSAPFGDASMLFEEITDWQTMMSSTAEVLASWECHFSGQLEANQYTLAQLFYRLIICQGQIVRSYLNAINLTDSPDLCAGALYLGMLFWLSASVFQFSANTHRCYDTTATIYSTLKKLFSHNEAATDQSYSENVKTWIIYTGAQMEHMADSKDKSQDSKWFRDKLKIHAQRSELLSWNVMRKTLNEFVCNDRILPAGSLWYDDLLR